MARPRSSIAAFVLRGRWPALFTEDQLRDRSTRVSGITLLAVESEDDVDSGFHFYGLVIKEIGTVAPCLDGVNRGLTERGWAAYYVEILDAACGGDGGGENDCSGDMNCASDGGISRVGFEEDHSVGDSGRYGHGVS